MLSKRIINSLMNKFINAAFGYHFCVANFKMNILGSQYHQKGSSQFQQNRTIKKLLKNNMNNIQNIQKQLDKKRQALLKLNGDNTIEEVIKQKYLKNQQVQKYLHVYVDLLNMVKSGPINNEWIYNLIGWYNMTFFFPNLIDRLLDASTQQLIYLINSLSWMKCQWNTMQSIIDKDTEKKRKKLIFFKRLSGKLELSMLRKLQKVFVTSVNFSKRKYYQSYVDQNLQKLLHNLTVNDSDQMEDIIWLFEKYVQTMNDNQYAVSRFQQFIAMRKPQLSDESVKRLINLYTLKGKINKLIYHYYIKPHLLKNKMGELSNLIQTIGFIINSESEDNAILKQVYELIEIKYKPSDIIQSKHLYMFHLYTHYLRIKGYRIKLPSSLQKKMQAYCMQRAEGRSSLNKTILQNKQVNNKIAKSKSKYISECLNVKNQILKQFQQTQRSDFQQNFHTKLAQTNLKDMKIYEKPIFCCFQLDYCLIKEEMSEFINVEIEGLRYIFTSGRLIRQKQIRDEILMYYGFKINHLDFNYYKLKTKLTQEDLVRNKSIIDN